MAGCPILVFISVLISSVVLVILLLGLGNFVGHSAQLDREKSSPFECGFTPRQRARLPFSFRFFLIAIVFLVFDVELVLLFPVAVRWVSSVAFSPLVVVLVFIAGLLGGLYYELNQGRLNWAS